MTYNVFGGTLSFTQSINLWMFATTVRMEFVCEACGLHVSDVCDAVTVAAGALNWRAATGLFTWKQHERVLSVLMQLFCHYHDKVFTGCVRCLCQRT